MTTNNNINEILDSGIMIGQNKPTAKVTIEGLGNNFNWGKLSKTRFPKGEGDYEFDPSLVKLNGGRLLFMYVRGDNLYQAYIDENIDCVLENDNVITDEVLVIEGKKGLRATLCQVDRELFFTISYTRSKVSNEWEHIARVEVYKCKNNDGSMWELYGTLDEQLWGTYGLAGDDLGVTDIVEVEGNLIVAAPYYGLDLGYLIRDLGFYLSEDGGKTWTMEQTFRSGPFGQGLSGTSRKLAVVDGVIYHTWGSNYGAEGNFVLNKGEDGGKTWTRAFRYAYADFKVVNNFLGSNSTVFPMNNTLYILSYGNGLRYKIYKVTPEQFEKADESLEIIGEVSLNPENISNNTGNVSFIDDRIVFMNGAKGNRIRGSSKSIELAGLGVTKNKVQPTSISISRNKGMAGSLTLELSNKDGVLAPDGKDNPNLLWPNKKVTIEQGYGKNQLKTFTGLIDSVDMKTFPQIVTVNARDSMKVLLDHYAERNGHYVLIYNNNTIEDIWKDLVTLAGLEYNIVEETGLTITRKEFNWETYMDCISWLDEIAGFQTYCDAEGKMNFIRDGRPSEVVVKHEFVEGKDIIGLGYTIDDSVMYSKVVVFGQTPEVKNSNDKVIEESEVIEVEMLLPARNYWNIPDEKVLRIDAPDADTVEKCEIIADKAIYLMQTRARQISFQIPGRPDLEIGDFVRVIESSTTASEIYRITDYSSSQTNGRYVMDIDTYYHGEGI